MPFDPINPMKALLCFFIPACVFGEEPRILRLEYKEGVAVDYPAQIQAKFKQLLDSDPDLAKEFGTFEEPPPENARGRYDGEAGIQVLILSESEHADFRTTGGTKEFELKIALYYRFAEAFHRGKETRSGFFANFTVTGNLTYRPLKNEEFELEDSQVVAKFQGFSRTLVAQKPEGDNTTQKDGHRDGGNPSK